MPPSRAPAAEAEFARRMATKRAATRYRPGKPVHEEESSDDDEEDQEQEEQRTPARQQQRSQQRVQSHRPKPPVHQEDEDEDDDEDDGFVTDEEEGDSKQAAPTTKPKAYPTVAASTAESASIAQPSLTPTAIVKPPSGVDSDKDEETSEEGSETGSSEEESSSEEEAPQRKFQRPTFVRKADRQATNDTTNSAFTDLQSSTAVSATTALDLNETARRKAQADLLLKDKLERDALARAAGKKAWDDDEEVDPEQAVDDTDGIDPEAEHAAWKLRELRRLKRDREAIELREKEIEEIERRRNLSATEREKEDAEYISKQKEEREEGRSKANYLARYHHKGAFFQDDAMAEILKKRDIMGAKFQDEVDKSTLPEYMRVRDMTKLGKKGRTRYTDLRGQDTGRFGEDVKRWRGAGDDNRGGARDRDGSGDYRGVDERFLPDRDRHRDMRDRGPTGANASAVGPRRDRNRSRSRSPPRRDNRRDRSRDRDRGDSYRPTMKRTNRSSRSYSRSMSRSHSPPRRKRSPSPRSGDRDKRRRMIEST